MDMSVDPAPATAGSTSLVICLWVLNKSDNPFSIRIQPTETVDALRDAIVKKWKTFADIESDQLKLWMLHASELTKPESTLATRIRSWGPDPSKFADVGSPLYDFFAKIPPLRHLHVIVQSPHHAKGYKRGADDSFTDGGKGKQFHMDPVLAGPTENVSTSLPKEHSPDRLTTDIGITNNVLTAFTPFEKYIQHLAEGKFDAFLDTHCRADKVTHPNLLLHGLGNCVDMKKIDELFVEDRVHLFNTSGSGKTRLTLDGLCHNWGFYISCSMKEFFTGSRDFQAAIAILKSLNSWNQGTGTDRLHGNARAADRIFAMLFCTRVFTLEKFISSVPPDVDPVAVRRRWVLLQVMPPVLGLEDIFMIILRSIRCADTQVMLQYVRTTMVKLLTSRHLLFPSTPFFVVFDEAQDAVKCLPDSFPSTTLPLKSCSALYELYRFANSANIFNGVIISGTALSMEIMETVDGSVSAKEVRGRFRPTVFTDVGNFLDTKIQEAYVRKHVTLSNEPSDRRLLERIGRWFLGRHRLTASLIELFLYEDDVPRHRVLTAFAKQLTGFTITDATDLEDK